MSDSNGRPIMTITPSDATPFWIGGAPVVIASQMPDMAPGFTVVNRRGVTIQNDPFSAGWCNLFKFDARIGGSVTCPNAARLLRIR